LIGVILRESLSARQINRFADHLIRFAYGFAECVVKPLLDESDGKMRDVDADPSAVEALGNLHGGAAAAEGIENNVTLVGAGFDDAIKQGLWLLSWIAEALSCY
jgi:hypothetical protein